MERHRAIGFTVHKLVDKRQMRRANFLGRPLGLDHAF
jgi:hypothetical protein